MIFSEMFVITEEGVTINKSFQLYTTEDNNEKCWPDFSIIIVHPKNNQYVEEN